MRSSNLDRTHRLCSVICLPKSPLPQETEEVWYGLNHLTNLYNHLYQYTFESNLTGCSSVLNAQLESSPACLQNCRDHWQEASIDLGRCLRKACVITKNSHHPAH